MERLDRLSRDLSAYRQAVAAHHQAAAAYHQRREALRAQLLPAAEAALLREEEAAEAAAGGRLAAMRTWLSSALGAPEAEAPPAWRSAAQRAAVARVRVEAQLAERLGAPSPAPAPPKGALAGVDRCRGAVPRNCPWIPRASVHHTP